MEGIAATSPAFQKWQKDMLGMSLRREPNQQSEGQSVVHSNNVLLDFYANLAAAFVPRMQAAIKSAPPLQQQQTSTEATGAALTKGEIYGARAMTKIMGWGCIDNLNQTPQIWGMCSSTNDLNEL